MKEIAFSSNHWPVSVSCAPSFETLETRQCTRNCTPRVPCWWMPTDEFAACVNNLASPPGGLTEMIASWSTAAGEHAVLPAAHVVSAELQDLLELHRNATDVAGRRKISKTIWRGEQRRWLPVLLRRDVLLALLSLVVPITSTGPKFSVLRLWLLEE